MCIHQAVTFTRALTLRPVHQAITAVLFHTLQCGEACSSDLDFGVCSADQAVTVRCVRQICAHQVVTVRCVHQTTAVRNVVYQAVAMKCVHVYQAVAMGFMLTRLQLASVLTR